MTFSRTLFVAAIAAFALPAVAQKDPDPWITRPSFVLSKNHRDLFIDQGPANGYWAITVGLDLFDGPLPPLGNGELIAFEPLFVGAAGRLDATGFAWQPIDLLDPVIAGQSALLQVFVVSPRLDVLNSSQPMRVEFDAPKIDEPTLPPGEMIHFIGADPIAWQADAVMWCACGRVPEVGAHLDVTAPTGGHRLHVGEVFWYDDLAQVTVTIIQPAPGVIVTEGLETLSAEIPLGTRCNGLVIDLKVVRPAADKPLPRMQVDETPAGSVGIAR